MRRNRMSPELMEALQILKFSFKTGMKMNFMFGMARNEEELWLEDVTNQLSKVPEDLRSFSEYLLSVIS